MTLSKKKSMFGVSFLLVVMMQMPSIVRATCTSIDEYTMPNGRTIICFGDCHFDSVDGAQAEQDAFIAAAREYGAYCIVEDALSYKGNDLCVRNAIDTMAYETCFRPHDVVMYPTSAMFGLAGRCGAEAIECYNAEFRCPQFAYYEAREKGGNAQVLSELRESIIKELEVALHEVQGVSCMCPDMLTDLRDKSDYVIADLRHGDASTKNDRVVLSDKLFDLKLVACLEQLLVNQGDKRPIFVFVGTEHGQALEKYLYQKYDFHKNLHKDTPVMTRRVINSLRQDAGKVDSIADPVRRQEEAHTFLAKNRVDIRGYFAQDAAAIQ